MRWPPTTAYANGSNSVTKKFTATTTTASPCPSVESCYKVTVTKTVPLYLVQIVGYAGNATLNGGGAQSLSASAIASPSGVNGAEFCVLALGGGGVDLTSNGGPKANLAGCDVGSNSSMTCNGHDLGADAGYAVGTDTNCGAVTHSNQAKIIDPYAALASKISRPTPARPSGIGQQPTSRKHPGTQTKITGAQSGGSNDRRLRRSVALPAMPPIRPAPRW